MLAEAHQREALASQPDEIRQLGEIQRQRDRLRRHLQPQGLIAPQQRITLCILRRCHGWR